MPSRGANATLTIDLEKQEIRGPDGGVIKFDIDLVPQALPAERSRQHRADAREGLTAIIVVRNINRIDAAVALTRRER